MKKFKIFTILPAFTAVFIVSIIGAQACGEVKDVVTKSFDAQDGGLLKIESDRGSIDIKTHLKDEVIIQVIRYADVSDDAEAQKIFNEFSLEFSQDENTVSVRGKVDENMLGIFNNSNKLKVKYEATIPEKFDVDLNTAGGSIVIGDLDGKVEARTAGGSLNFGRIDGPVLGKTAGGSIRLESSEEDVDLKTAGGSIAVGPIEGDAQLETSGGSIRVGEVEGTLVAYTAGGSISIEGVAGSVDAKTSGGSVRAAIREQPKNECRLKTSAGNIGISLPEHISLNIKAQTFGGKVTTDLPITVKGDISKSQIQGTLNGGGPLLLLETSGGNITISKGKEML